MRQVAKYAAVSLTICQRISWTAARHAGKSVHLNESSHDAFYPRAGREKRHEITELDRPSLKRGFMESYYKPEWGDPDEFEYKWDDEDPQIHKKLHLDIRGPVELRFDIDTGDEWANWGNMVDRSGDGVAETCEEFRMCSNQASPDGGACMTMTTSFYCEGCDPATGLCELYRHARMKTYKPNSLRQQWVFDVTTKQIMTMKNTEECLTVLAGNDQVFPNGGMDPCAEVYSGLMFYGGGYVYNMPCLPEESVEIYQQFEYNDGLLRTLCPHNNLVSDAFPFMVIASEDNMAGGVFNYRFGQEVEITMNFKQGAVEILNYYLNDTTYNQIFTHGCWCAHLADQKDNEFQGVDIEDELDYICKRWYMARKCLRQVNGACDNTQMSGTYTVSYESDQCPWDGTTDCGADVVNSGLNSDPCAVANCEVDTYYSGEIRDYLDEIKAAGDTWQPLIKDRQECKCKECRTDKFWIPNLNPKKCAGTPPHVYFVDAIV